MPKPNDAPERLFVYVDPDQRSFLDRHSRLDVRFKSRSDFIRHLLTLGIREYCERQKAAASEQTPAQ